MTWRFTLRFCVSSAAHHVRDADALQHAHDPPVIQAVHDALEERRIGDPVHLAPGEVREPVDEEAEQEDEQAAPDDLAPDRRLIVAARSRARSARGAS